MKRIYKYLLTHFLRLFVNWIPLSLMFPNEDEVVWLYNKNNNVIHLGCHTYVRNEGWFWAISTGVIYSDNNIIMSECEFDDDYEFTHFSILPKLPNNIKYWK